MQYTLRTSTRYNKQALHKFLAIFGFLIFLLSTTTDTAQADSPPNISTDIPWTDTGGVFDLSANPRILDATFNGVVDTMTAFNHARRQEEIQLGLTNGTLGTLDLPEQTIWDGMSDDEKSLFILNEERTDRAGMEPNVLGLPLEAIETHIDNIAQVYAQVLVDNNAFGHEEDGRKPWNRIADDPIIGPCHEFLVRAENLAAFWASAQSPLYIERSFYNWIYADGESNWGHREAAFLQDIPLRQTDPFLGFKNNVGSPDSEGLLGIGVIHSADYNPSNVNADGIGTIVVMNFFDPLSSDTCVWDSVLPNAPSASSTPTSASIPNVTPAPTETYTPSPTPSFIPTFAPTPVPIDTNTPLPIATPTFTPTPVLIDTNTPLPTATPTFTPTPLPIDTNTPLPTATPTFTPTPVLIDTNTPLPTATSTPSLTSSPIPTNTPTSIPPTRLPSTATWTPTLDRLPTESPTSTETSTSVPTSVPTATATATATAIATMTAVPLPTVIRTEGDPLSGASPQIHDSFEPETHADLQADYHTVTGLAENVSNIELNVTFNDDLSEYVYDQDRNMIEGKVVFDIHYENPTGDVDDFPENRTALDAVVIVATIPKYTLFDPAGSGFINEAGVFIPQDVVWQYLDGSGPVGIGLPSGDDVAIRVGNLAPNDRGRLQISMRLGNNVRPEDLSDISLATTIAAANLRHQIFYRLTDFASAAQIEVQRSLYLPIIMN